MGLDIVEIILEAEDTFGISLPDDRMQKIRTVGELSDCIVETMGLENEGTGLRNEIYKELCEAIQSTTPKRASQEQFTPDTPLAKLFPLFGRRRSRRRLAKVLGVELPSLQRSHWVSTVLIVGAIVLGNISGMLTLLSIFPGKNSPEWIIGVLGILVIFLAIFFWWLVGRVITLPFAIHWPKKISTIGDLSGYILKYRYGEIVKNEGKFNREEVWTLLQSIVASILGINPCDVKPESRFIEDLGA